MFHIDLDVEARNSGAMQAAKLQNCSFVEAVNLQDNGLRFEFEGVGGACDSDVDHPDEKIENTRCLFTSQKLPDLKAMSVFLSRDTEVAAKCRPGRSTDAGENIKESATTFASALQRIGQPTNLNSRGCLQLGSVAEEFLKQEAGFAEQLKLAKQHTVSPGSVEVDDGMSVDAPATNPLLIRLSVVDVSKGPAGWLSNCVKQPT